MKSRNRLADETSPYLLQHADNPLDWQPWGEAALAQARREDKPILLSIGYSACHWCHVMAHESFEHAPTAELMNHLFINIKVDREERPDIDRIYQRALQLLTHRSGGWPLTMALDPDTLAPFFGGTYFPREARYGLPPFSSVLKQVEAYYREHRADLAAQSAALVETLQSMDAPTTARDDPPSALALDMARQQLEHAFDEIHGGFGGAPKFPHPPNLTRLLRHSAMIRRRGHEDAYALHMARYTLARMASNGIYDQLGGGFCRYSVDARWMIPHFEKMLYDNALLLPLYTDVWQISGDERFANIARETAAWMQREMQSPAGGYYSSLDADSEGEEGSFYVWTRDEVRSLLNADEYAVFEQRFGLDQEANFEGHWHLYCRLDIDEIAQALDRPIQDVEHLLSSARARLFEHRAQRVRPGLDDKVLTAWNGLAIRGMAIAARALGDDAMLSCAERAADFVRRELWRDDRLLVTWKEGRAQLDAYLDDYAFMLDAELELLQTAWRDEDLAFAITLADALIERFEDREHGGFYFTAHDHETLLYRPKTWADDALPAGNAIATRALQRLGHLLGETRYLIAAERALRAAWPQIAQLAYAHNAMLDALEEWLEPPQMVILRAQSVPPREWLRACHADYAPARLAFAIPGDAHALPGLLAERKPPQEGTLAYVCTGTTCGLPVKSLDKLKQILRDNGSN
ncbi:MAG: thioredoxin domain-containing protein [Chromatiales bacterium]|jgi:uncharacterized protein YyaL (SSP411 family)|nr:thioredoxin domain-containing protein [Chromatiales bacterium]